jgi:hypothetical protein
VETLVAKREVERMYHLALQRSAHECVRVAGNKGAARYARTSLARLQ